MDVKCKTGMKLCNRIKAKHIDFALTEKQTAEDNDMFRMWLYLT